MSIFNNHARMHNLKSRNGLHIAKGESVKQYKLNKLLKQDIKQHLHSLQHLVKENLRLEWLGNLEPNRLPEKGETIVQYVYYVLCHGATQRKKYLKAIGHTQAPTPIYFKNKKRTPRS